MGSLAEQKIPVINFKEEHLKPGSDSWISALKQVRYGFEEYGCLEIVCDQFPFELHNSIFDAAEDVFNLPKETKMQKTSTRPGKIGYIAGLPELPLYESIALDSATTLEEVEYFTNIMWPAGNNSFRDSVHSFSKRIEVLHEMVTRMVFENYGVEGLFNSFWEKRFYVCRFFKYKAPHQTNESEVGIGAHTDSTFLSILHQHQVKGLQIKTKDGQWIDVKPKPSSLFVIAGDVLKVWSNDRVRSCEHQVMVSEDKIRYSAGLFTFIKGVMQVPEELIDDEYPLRYKPFDHAEYNRYLLSEDRDKNCPINAFCGI
ncbi:Protein SRG1 [Morus notabilis]|uniref:2-oxoglutarate-dependent dioxygenase DAO n=1 Tax=Morus notabilis TaxID=981085 RepID=W9SCZ4_9ROSA|nr:probable 2-oxoglutarate-dependent dioxygenase AOP1 [Morus notabilis]EXC25839.1 Protein SRG1 [Morus notabilis]